jgi:hypothetical protein
LFGCLDKEVVISGQRDYAKEIEYLGGNTFYVFGVYTLAQGDIAFLYFLYLPIVYLIERSFQYSRKQEIGRLKLPAKGEWDSGWMSRFPFADSTILARR